jgi:hypothetical protein
VEIVMTRKQSLRRLVIPPKRPEPINPAQLKHAEERAADVQNQIADMVTRFAGSMTSSTSTCGGSVPGSDSAWSRTRSGC